MLDAEIIEVRAKGPDRCEVGPAGPDLMSEILSVTERTYAAQRGRLPFAFPENGHERGQSAVRAAFRDRLGRLGPSPLIFAATARPSGALLGYIRLDEAGRPGGAAHPAVAIEDLWVAPPMRGRGIGRLLVAYVMALAERRGWDNLSALVWHGDDAMQEVFADAGFAPQSHVWRFGPKDPARPYPPPGVLDRLRQGLLGCCWCPSWPCPRPSAR